MVANIQKFPFHLQSQIDDMFVSQPRQLAFRAHSLNEFNSWKVILRAKFLDLLGIAGHVPPTHPKTEHLQSVDAVPMWKRNMRWM
jgi:hypothetical protein